MGEAWVAIPACRDPLTCRSRQAIPTPVAAWMRALVEAVFELKAKGHYSHPGLPASGPQEQLRNAGCEHLSSQSGGPRVRFSRFCT